MLKAAIAKAVPGPVLRAGLAARERILLSSAPRQYFDVSALRRVERPELATIWTDPVIESAWSRDSEGIARAMPLREAGTFAVCPGDRRALYYLAAHFKPNSVLEIGTSVGGSTTCIAQALETHAAADAKMVTVDIIDVNDAALMAARSIPHEHTPREMLTRLGLADRVSFQIGRSADFLNRASEKFDFIFIDGDHSAPAVYQDVALALGVLSPGGIIVLHDYYPQNRPIYPSWKQICPGLEVALKTIAEETSGALEAIPLGVLPWETKDGVNVTTLAVLSRKGQDS